MRKLTTCLVALCATAALWASNFTPAAFSIASGKQVYFSPGNLQCSGVTTKNYVWSFAENQYDMLGTANVSGSALADKIDLFGWSGSTATYASYGISVLNTNTYYSGDFVDWGTNTIGTNASNTYRTLTKDEWDYLLNTRDNSSVKKGTACINLNSDGSQYANGLILLPDNWTAPDGINFISGVHDYTSQTFTSDQWQELEAAGAVFLPAMGIRNRAIMSDVQSNGYYWSATAFETTGAGSLSFSSNEISLSAAASRFPGRAVRLVQDIVNYAVTITTPENGTVTADKTTAAAGETVTLTIAPATDYELGTLTVKDANDNTITVSEGNKFTMPASAVTVTATFKRPDTQEWVDLGLPSGLRWATCNVGAYSPEIYGNYYAWGETDTKSNYSWDNYKFGAYKQMSKYCTASDYGTVDNLTTLEAADDAAAVNWGGLWRMPTDAEWTELRENCDWTWTADYNNTGVAGCIVASKTNDNSIFLPAMGEYSGTDNGNVGKYGYYWSSSLHGSVSVSAWDICFGETQSATSLYNYRKNGLPVRPVQEVVKYAVTITTPENGTVTADETKAAEGKTVTLTITPDTGYELDVLSVKDAEDNKITVENNKFTMPASAVTVTATFKEIDYAINIASDIANGKVTAVATANYGDEVELTITPATGYELDVLTVKDAANNEILVSDNKFIMPASAVTVTATFKKIDYAITIDSEIANGKVTAAATANYGDEVELTITPDKGYKLEGITVKDADNQEIPVSEDNKFTMPASAVTVSATFKKIDYAITIDSEIANGKVTAAATANYGDEVELTITPATGYELDVLTVKDAANNEILVSDNKFIMPASAVTVTATFKIITPTALQNAEMVEIYAADGRIYGADGMQIFTLTGQNVTHMNGSLCGVYIVKVGDKAQKVVVK